MRDTLLAALQDRINALESTADEAEVEGEEIGISTYEAVIKELRCWHRYISNVPLEMWIKECI